MAVVLMVLVLVAILPAAPDPAERPVNPNARSTLAGRGLLVLFMVATLIPFVTILSTALQPQGSIPTG